MKGHWVLVAVGLLALHQEVRAQWARPANQRQCGPSLDCVMLRDCPSLAGLARPGQRPTREEVLQLQKAHCGFEGIQPKVCCNLRAPAPSSASPFGGSSGAQGGRPTPSRPKPAKPQGAQGAQGGLDSNSPGLRLLPLDTCGPLSADRIINGEKAQVMELPWMARLGYRRDEFTQELDYNCGGSLISNRYVLTAAHCISENTGLVPVAVRLGEQDTTTDVDCSLFSGERVCAPPVVDVDIEQIIKHKNYGENRFQNDIALLRLVSAVSFSDAVKPVCLPVDSMELRKDLTGKKVVVAGWGRVANRNGAGGSKTLMKVSVPVSRHEDCAEAYSRLNLVIASEKQMCAGDKGKDSCQGDSGGPLTSAGDLQGTLRVVQHGVVSFGPSHCATEGTPGVYTKVAHYMPWIVSNLEP